MRKRFNPVLELDATPIGEVEITLKSRHQLPQLLLGLRHIFNDAELNEEVFSIMEHSITVGRKGRPGMSLWEILVLGVMRLNLDLDYDALQDYSNEHKSVRGILGVDTKELFGIGKRYSLQTLKDNIMLLDEQTLKLINIAVVKSGHRLKKKVCEAQIGLILKSDSYVVESNIHFPTDIRLAWDSARKCNDVIILLQRNMKGGLEGWRNHNDWRIKLKYKWKSLSDIHSRKGANYAERLRNSAETMLDYYTLNSDKIKDTLEELKRGSLDMISELLSDLLNKYHKYLELFIDQLDRRLLKGEKIPHAEKVFSIFEPHAEWVKKGKSNNRVELGHNVLVTTDQYHFIVDHKVMVNERDNVQPLFLMDRLEENYPKSEYSYKSLSFDRGFHSILTKASLSKRVELLILPKKGKKTKSETEEESRKEYRELRNQHSAVESNINELEQGGLNKVPDRGLEGFKKYVALGVLANNIKRIGKYLKEQRA